MKQSTCLSLCQKGKQMYFSFKLFSQMKVFKHIIPKLASMRVMSHLWNTLQMAQQWLAIFATKGLTGDWSWDPFISSSTVWPLDHWSIYLQKLKIWYLMYFLLLPNAKKIFIWCFFLGAKTLINYWKNWNMSSEYKIQKGYTPNFFLFCFFSCLLQYILLWIKTIDLDKKDFCMMRFLLP